MKLSIVLFCLFLSFATPVQAHDWYDYDCCSEKDCHPIPCDQLAEKNHSVWYRGFEFFGTAVRPSKDTDCHVCITNENKPGENEVPHCVYIQNGS